MQGATDDREQDVVLDAAEDVLDLLDLREWRVGDREPAVRTDLHVER